MRVNGKEMTLVNKQSLLQFLEINGFDVATLAVARNGEIVPKSSYDAVLLCENGYPGSGTFRWRWVMVSSRLKITMNEQGLKNKK